ncbi:hypothetical protein G3I31_30985 [Streptomyces sp. SID9913]|uniref:hypothetical protein n=1 Tax=Streptomyces sp. SID9913 TaxID=2706117 RepID=UPI0013DC1D5F|nr:hypothetical protein [Streptomyces sp. SID9913]NED22410.1 hypothetical protein [Streptomyces sp. SID9913]
MSKDQMSVPPHVARALRQIDGWTKATGQHSPTVEPGSSLSGDDAKIPTLMVSSAAYQCFTHAVDHLHAVQALLFEARVIHSYAPYSLLRAAVEAAGEAIWLLEPSSRQERIRRCLKRAYENVRQGKDFMDLSGLQPSGRPHAERVQELKDLAVQNGLDPHDVCGRWSTQRQLAFADQAVGDGKETYAQNLWQICSGFAHGREWATLGVLERTVHSQVGNVVQLKLSSSTDVLLNMLYVAALLTGKAKTLYDERRTRHH